MYKLNFLFQFHNTIDVCWELFCYVWSAVKYLAKFVYGYLLKWRALFQDQKD